MLRNTDGHISGEKLSDELGITRSAVWKHINSLKEDGYEIDSVRNKGYRLIKSPDIPDSSIIKAGLETELIGSTVIAMKTVDSTNEEVKRLAAEGAREGLTVVSAEQTAGKGRFSRSWSSGNDGGIYFSFLLRPELPPADIASITLAAGYAVCLAIREFTGLDARIKWPNDIIIGRRKLCGILTEMTAQSDRIDHVIVGIGINVNNHSFPEEISGKATSLYLEAGKEFDRNALLSCVLNMLDKVITRFLISLSIDDIEHFKSLCVTMGKTVKISRAGKEISGEACSITAAGELIIRTEDNTELVINSGEVTVQGIY